MGEQSTTRKILREADVSDRTQRSRAQRWRDIRAGKFPAPVQLGVNSIGWYEDEIDAWLDSRPRVAYAPSRDAQHGSGVD